MDQQVIAQKLKSLRRCILRQFAQKIMQYAGT